MEKEEHFVRQRISPDRLPPAVVKKWSPGVLGEGFVPFPKRLLRCLPEIFTGEKVAEDLAVILAIADYQRPNLTRLPSLEYLAFLAGLEPGSFQERLTELEKLGLISVGGNENELDIEMTGLFSRIEELTTD